MAKERKRIVIALGLIAYFLVTFILYFILSYFIVCQCTNYAIRTTSKLIPRYVTIENLLSIYTGIALKLLII